MKKLRILFLLPALLAVLRLPVFAQEEACFALGEEVTGICLTEVAEPLCLRLGERQLRAGDVLTAGQAARVTASGEAGQVEYLPVMGQVTQPPVTVTLGKRLEAPVAENSTAETYKNLPITGKLKVTGENLTYTLTRQPRRGTAVLHEDGTFTYTPKKNKVGIDSFTFTASDSAGKTSREATVTITILKPGDGETYADTQGMDCQFTAEWLKNTGIFRGETVGENLCFQPEKCVTRGEFVAMLVKVLDLPVDEELTQTGYTDQIPQWLQPYLAAALRSGLTAALPDEQTFGAEVEMPAREAAQLVDSVLDADQQTMSALEADAPLTRAQAAQLLYQVGKQA